MNIVKVTKGIIALSLLSCAGVISAQSASPLLQPWQFFPNQAGLPCANCLLYTYAAGTTTPQPTYTDASGSIQNANPVVLDARGTATVWLGPNAYKFVLQTAGGVTVKTVDNVPGNTVIPASQSFLGSNSSGRAVAAPYTPVNKAGDTGIGSLNGSAGSQLAFDHILVGTSLTVAPTSYAALQSAVTAACSGTTPGSVSLAPGLTFTVTATWSTIPSNCSITWNGATLQAGPALNSDVVDLTGVAGVHFHGALYINGNEPAQTAGSFGALLDLNNTNDSTFDDLHLSNAVDTCLALVGSSRNHFTSVDARSCGAPYASLANPNYQGAGVHVDAGSNDNQFGRIYNDGATGVANVYVTSTSTGNPSDRNQFDEIIAKNAVQKGVLIYGAARHTHFGNVYVDTCGSHGSQTGDGFLTLSSGSFAPDYTNAGKISVTNCQNVGIEIDGNWGSYSSLIATRTVGTGAGGPTDTGAGIYIGGSHNSCDSLSSTLNDTWGLRIDGDHNTCSAVIAVDNGQFNPGTFAGVLFDSSGGSGSYNTITGLISRNSATVGQKYGVQETNAAGNNIIQGAQLTGNASAASAMSSNSVLCGLGLPCVVTGTGPAAGATYPWANGIGFGWNASNGNGEGNIYATYGNSNGSAPAFSFLQNNGTNYFLVGTFYRNGNWLSPGEISATKGIFAGALTVGSLPAASSSAGLIYVVSDSTTIGTEGQACVGGSSNYALAFSNGGTWKCF